MATFRAVVKSERSSVSRLGRKFIDIDANAWNSGIAVYGERGPDNTIIWYIELTGGSNNLQNPPVISSTVEENDKHVTNIRIVCKEHL